VDRDKKSRIDVGAKEGTINRELACVSHLFTKALEWKWIDKQPAPINRFKEGPGRLTYLTAKQAERLVEAAKEDQNPQMYPFVLIGLGTSMRKSEILSLRQAYIDTARSIIHIPQTKAGTREQPITASLAAFLADYIEMLPEGAEWLFPSRTSSSGRSMRIQEPFRRIVIRAGLNPKDVTPHTLRHTAITQLVQAGVDLPTVQRISGHKTLAMVARYAHQNSAHIQTAMDKLDARYTTKTG
jgi:integrase